MRKVSAVINNKWTAIIHKKIWIRNSNLQSPLISSAGKPGPGT